MNIYARGARTLERVRRQLADPSTLLTTAERHGIERAADRLEAALLEAVISAAEADGGGPLEFYPDTIPTHWEAT